MTSAAIIEQLRTLIITTSPDPTVAAAVRECPTDTPLDSFMPFSSVVALGMIVAVEDRFHIVVTRAAFETAVTGGATLEKFAAMVEGLRG